MFICLFVTSCSLGVFLFSFVSCDPPINVRFPSSEDDGDGNDYDDDDDYEDCRGYEQCEDVCELIYNESWVECSELDSDEVNDLQRIHSRLKASSLSRAKLIEISNEEGEVELNALEEYLEIGVDGWLKQIDGYETKEGNDVDPYDDENAQKVISWLAEEENVARILAEVDGGSRVLEALLMTATSGFCFWKNSRSADANYSSTVSFNSNFSGGKITIEIPDGSTPIDIEIDDSGLSNLYDLLSCTNVDGNSGPDIFSLAADEENRYLFELAFDLLDEVCEDSSLRSGEEEKEDICLRAMMCVVAIKNVSNGNASASEIASWDGWGTGSNSYGAKDRFRNSGFKDTQACDISDREFGGNIDLD